MALGLGQECISRKTGPQKSPKVEESSSHVRRGGEGQNQTLNLSSFENGRPKENSGDREHTVAGCHERRQANNTPKDNQMEAE